jgi:peptide/nickel transport system permease protein
MLFSAVTIVAYILFFIIPADPARQFAGKGATPETVANARMYLGLDKPIYVQYGHFVERLVVHQDLGHSWYNRESVNQIVADAAPVTASLVIGGAVFWFMLAIPIGVLSAVRRGSLLDRGATSFVLIGISAHPVWIGLIFAWLFGYKWGLTPITGYAVVFNPPPGQAGGPVQWAYHLILPWMTFMILFAALYVRMIRANVIETLNEDHVRTARGKGASEWTVMRRHVLRNVMLPVVTILGMDIGLALGGAIFTETVYGLPGLGRTSVQALDADLRPARHASLLTDGSPAAGLRPGAAGILGGTTTSIGHTAPSNLVHQTAATRPTSATPAPRLLSAATTSSAD